jgi:lactate racemase
MRLVTLEYDQSTVELESPDDATVIEGVAADKIYPALSDPAGALEEALDQPMGSEPLEQLVDKDSRVTITVNDWMGGSYYAAPAVLQRLKRRGIKEENIRIMIAGGTHAKVTRKQLYASNMGRWKTNNKPPFAEAFRILPPEIIENWSKAGYDRIERHDSADPEAVVNLGHTQYGDLLEVNKIFLESDVVVHLGWGPLALSPWGGLLGSGFLLGTSSARAILGHHGPDVVNHRQGHHSDPHSQTYSRHKVALLEKLQQSVSAKLFLIDPYFNTRGQFAGRWWAGDWRPLREEQVRYALAEITVDVPQSADLLIMDCPPWMFHGATSNPMLAMSHVAATMRAFLPPNPLLRKGGIVVCVTPCNGTIDDWYRPSDREAIRLYAQLGRDIGDLFDRYSLDFLHRPEYIYKYRFCWGHHPLHAFWLLAAEQYVFDQASQVIFAGAPASEPLSQMGIAHAPDVTTAIQMANEKLGKRPDITVLPRCSKRMGLIFNVLKS